MAENILQYISRENFILQPQAVLMLHIFYTVNQVPDHSCQITFNLRQVRQPGHFQENTQMATLLAIKIEVDLSFVST